MDRERLGRYELVAHLATGGMGRVSIARMAGEGGFERHVVVKSLDLVGTDDEEAQAMFLDEARILGMLHHQHVAAIQEVARDDEGTLFLVLEYVHGHTAHDIWERSLDLDVQLPLDFTLSIVAAAASGLHYAHGKRGPDGKRLGIVHRDVTLSNLMVGFDGAIKVIDFGIAKARERRAQTQAGFIKGKLGYMAPEQLRGQAVDPRTDVFALGIVLYELTTMRRTFREESDRATIERIKAGKYVRPSELVPDYPVELEAIVARALRTDAKDRYQDADAMRRDVEALGHRLHLVLGDAAVVEVMTQLFEERAEPWARVRARTRAESEISIEQEWADPHGAMTIAVDTPQLRPEKLEKLAKPRVVSDTATTGPLPTVGGAPRPAAAELKSIAEIDPSSSGTAQALTITGERRRSREQRPVTKPSELAAQAAANGRVVTNSSGELVAIGEPPAAIAEPSKARRDREDPEKLRVTDPVRRPAHASRPTWILWLAIVAVILAIGAIVAAILLREDDGASADPPAPSTQPPSTLPSTKPEPKPDVKSSPKKPDPPPKPTTVKIKVSSTPGDATVLLDEKRLGHTPLDIDVPVQVGKHQLRLRMKGYFGQARDVSLEADVDEKFVLAPESGNR